MSEWPYRSLTRTETTRAQHISRFAGTDCRLTFLSSLCTSLSLFFRDLGCLFLLAPPWAAFPVERFKLCFLGPIRSFAEVRKNINLSPRHLVQRLPLTERKALFNLSQDGISAALGHVAYLKPKLWATTLKNQRLEERKAHIGTTILGVNNFKTLNHANLWWLEQWCIVECSNGLKSPERKDCCPTFFFSVQSNLY